MRAKMWSDPCPDHLTPNFLMFRGAYSQIPQVLDNTRPGLLRSSRSLRWILISPLVAVVALAMLMAATIWYLTESESNQQQQALMRDVNAAQRIISDRLQRAQDELSKAAAELPSKPGAADLRRIAETLFLKAPEVVFLAWVDRGGIIRFVSTSESFPTQGFDRVGTALSRKPSVTAFEYAISSKKPHYSAAISTQTDVEVDLHVPILRNGVADGGLVATYSLPAMLLSAIPSEISDRIAFSLIGP